MVVINLAVQYFLQCAEPTNSLQFQFTETWVTSLVHTYGLARESDAAGRKNL